VADDSVADPDVRRDVGQLPADGPPGADPSVLQVLDTDRHLQARLRQRGPDVVAYLAGPCVRELPVGQVDNVQRLPEGLAQIDRHVEHRPPEAVVGDGDEQCHTGTVESTHIDCAAGDRPICRAGVVSAVSGPDADPTVPDPETRNRLATDCRRCPALAGARECIAWGNGPADADVVVVGEAPGAGDPDADRWRGGNWTGLAYTSRHSGRRVRELMAAVGHPDAYYTNAVKCFPPDGEGSNREPTAEERANCRPYLRTELETVDPRVVVPTGRHATLSVLALAGDAGAVDGFLELVLESLDPPELDARVVPVLHPSYREVWLPRIGHTADSYRARLADLLAPEGSAGG